MPSIDDWDASTPLHIMERVREVQRLTVSTKQKPYHDRDYIDFMAAENITLYLVALDGMDFPVCESCEHGFCELVRRVRPITQSTVSEELIRETS